MPAVIAENNSEIMTQYFEFLINILSYDVVDRFTDIVIRKIINILQNIICNNVVNEESHLPHLSVILDKIKNIMCLRCDNKFLTLMVNNSKNSIPIWSYTTDYFLKLVQHILINHKKWSTKCQEYNKNQHQLTSNQCKIINVEKVIIQQIIEIYEKVLKNSEIAAGIKHTFYLFNS